MSVADSEISLQSPKRPRTEGLEEGFEKREQVTERQEKDFKMTEAEESDDDFKLSEITLPKTWRETGSTSTVSSVKRLAIMLIVALGRICVHHMQRFPPILKGSVFAAKKMLTVLTLIHPMMRLHSELS
ncbi:hypothetical protein FRX31_035466 [Thalictrum thalictroides]|uniref:Uncharacterized protein n=1 Tax=Thalictrum thalictroides TaxID=46969 RepID=A0A7J6UQZ9_THATH|nr:hypothetical protein FRX31_035466 [Thalictrum thalictroides]